MHAPAPRERPAGPIEERLKTGPERVAGGGLGVGRRTRAQSDVDGGRPDWAIRRAGASAVDAPFVVRFHGPTLPQDTGRRAPISPRTTVANT